MSSLCLVVVLPAAARCRARHPAPCRQCSEHEHKPRLCFSQFTSVILTGGPLSRITVSNLSTRPKSSQSYHHHNHHHTTNLYQWEISLFSLQLCKSCSNADRKLKLKSKSPSSKNFDRGCRYLLYLVSTHHSLHCSLNWYLANVVMANTLKICQH